MPPEANETKLTKKTIKEKSETRCYKDGSELRTHGNSSRRTEFLSQHPCQRAHSPLQIQIKEMESALLAFIDNYILRGNKAFRFLL